MLVFFAFLLSCSLNAQVYTDTTNLVADLEAGLYEEYILAPVSVTDTFFLPKQVTLSTDVVIKALDNLGFKPVLTGNDKSLPSYLFLVAGVEGGADIQLEGIHITGTRNDQKLISNGTFNIKSENINLSVINCDFVNIQGYNAIAKVYNSGGNITLDKVLVYNCGGKIIQVNYKDDLSTVNYVPLIGDLTITNSTFAKIYSRIFFELGVGDVGIDENDPSIKQRFNAGATNLTIDHCTFYDHIDVNVMQGRAKYEFAGDQTAIKEKLTITNTIFSNMDKNLNADSATITIFDYNYVAGFGKALAAEEIEDFNAEYGATNTVTVDPVFVDTTNGEWNLTLQNEANMIGSNGTPIGDPRWWAGIWYPTSVNKNLVNTDIAQIYSFSNMAIIQTKELVNGSISVFNISGQLVCKTAILSERTEIKLNKGLYLIKFDSNIGSKTQKVFVFS